MKRLVRLILLLLSAGMLAVAGLLIRLQLAPGDSLPQTLPVAAGEHEIAWLSPATSVSGWERFVDAVRRSGRRLQVDMPDLQAQLKQAYPPRSTDVPEVALTWKNASQRLVFRWYKVTSRWKTADWVDALLANRPAPLAIIGGSNSEAAWALARDMKEHAGSLPSSRQPVLLLTTATADRVSLREFLGAQTPLEDRERLTQIYRERTFRFCFTNNQMAVALIRFIRSQPELRTDADPAYLVQWDDDSYSYDLSDCLLHALNVQTLQGFMGDWGWASGFAQAGNASALLAGVIPWCPIHPISNPRLWPIPTSVGSFRLPNRHEADVAEDVSRELGEHPEQRRPVLFVTGQAQPSQRFLTALHQLDPQRSRRLVIATGDAIPFNSIYRDRRIIWPIQDLPMSMVFFFHCNPIDRQAGFVPSPEDVQPSPAGAPESSARADWFAKGDEPPSSSGTEDILLNSDIVETLAHTFIHNGQPCTDPDELINRLRRVRLDGTGIHLDGAGESFFAPSGNRRSATGEHMVYLQPVVVDGRVLPRSRLEVWKWQPINGSTMGWKPCAPPLYPSYKPPVVEGGPHR